MDMKKIYVVYYDWAFNGASEEGTLGIYENIDDAIARMDEYWDEERGMDYFDKMESEEIDERMRERYVVWMYADRHTRVEVMEQCLYSHEDVANGLA